MSGSPTVLAAALDIVASEAEVNVAVSPSITITGGIMPPGAVLMTAAPAAPAGWLLCDGAAVPRATYASLFSEIGTTFGAGDDATTFNVPDFRGRVPVGVGQGAGLTQRSRGASGGAEEHALGVAELPVHSHNYSETTTVPNTPARGGSNAPGDGYSHAEASTTPTGLGTGHANMPPWLALHYIIKH